MASLMKFKLLATHCVNVVESPTRSPVIHLRRRKKLRMLFIGSSYRRRFPRRNSTPEIQSMVKNEDWTDVCGGGGNKEKIGSRRKLKELFISSPPFDVREGSGAVQETKEFVPDNGGEDGGDGYAARRIGVSRSLRPVSATLRCRLLRRAWRPVLVTIPEQ